MQSNGELMEIVAAAERKAGLPDLEGSPRQVTWARQIRVDRLADAELWIARVPSLARTTAELYLIDLRSRRAATWWIQTRELEFERLLRIIIREWDPADGRCPSCDRRNCGVQHG